MGSSGMSRKGRRHLPKVSGDIGPADTARLFGDFRWNQWSPAGRLERIGFVLRQGRRNGSGLGWRWGFDILRVLAPVIAIVVGVIVVLALVVG